MLPVRFQQQLAIALVHSPSLPRYAYEVIERAAGAELRALSSGSVFVDREDHPGASAAHVSPVAHAAHLDLAELVAGNQDVDLLAGRDDRWVDGYLLLVHGVLVGYKKGRELGSVTRKPEHVVLGRRARGHWVSGRGCPSRGGAASRLSAGYAYKGQHGY